MTKNKDNKKQTSLFNTFSRYVQHRGKKIKVDMPKYVEVPPAVSCPVCKKGFKTPQGFGVHKLTCKPVESHGDGASTPSCSSTITTSATSSPEADDTQVEVKNTLNYILCRVEERVQFQTVKKGKSQNKGATRREQHSAVFKSTVIHKVQPGTTQEFVADEFSISQSLVSKWLKK